MRSTKLAAVWTGVVVLIGLAGCNTADSGAVTRAQPQARAAEAGPAAVTVEGVENLQRDGELYVAGKVTPAGLENLRRQGVRTVIDLRLPEQKQTDEAAEAKRLGMDYVAVPMKSDEMTAEQAATILQAMKNHPSGGVLIHCMSGNRAGGAYGLYLGASGQCSAQTALERARRAGLKNEKLAGDVQRQLSTRPAGE